jgi:hypothetical protein
MSMTNSIKYLFILKSKSTGSGLKYSLAFLDTNLNYYYDEYNDTTGNRRDKDYTIYKIEKFKEVFSKYKLTSETTVYLCADKQYDFFTSLLLLLRSVINFNFNTVNFRIVLSRVNAAHRIISKNHSQNFKTMADTTMYKKLNVIYRFLKEYKLCPWLDFELQQDIELSGFKIKRSKISCMVGLYYAIIRDVR